MNDVGRFIKAIRLRKNISELKAAHRCGLSIDEYHQIEKEPDKVTSSKLCLVFKAIEMTDQEFFDFNELALNNADPSNKTSPESRLKLELLLKDILHGAPNEKNQQTEVIQFTKKNKQPSKKNSKQTLNSNKSKK